MHFNPRRASSGNGAFLISNTHPRPAIKTEQALPSRSRYPALHRLHKFRAIILPVLLMSTFTTLLLGAIYAYCVAKPHTDIGDILAVDSNAEADSSIFGKRETAATATETTAGTKSISSSYGESEVALLFYTLTAPGLSIFHNIFELIMHHHTPRHMARRSIYITFLATSSLLICGWITTLAFWMHCELPTFNQNKAGQAVCPIQVRGHFMYGIHEVSIARIVVGWIIVLAYIGHVVLLGFGYNAQKRIWRIIGGAEADGDVEMTHGEARLVVVRFDEDDKDDRALAKEANVL
ncbi:hypothetical protein G647_06033 [Cladophialophora carrionii CBS 160.54]|uniref:Uncharacterized protein n=1 Tax=Cladophialophora carrionii CBS 160.54 TaxID=1279043 RepID=V9D6Q8_9EURO|nr:uncharacterized protein G647_06033 [Cladophialophora carrionii CBS 160.54]ETI21963.1 hypothetical protein G647_06033 [Cladophialophora carrionii CBS 160.54]